MNFIISLTDTGVNFAKRPSLRRSIFLSNAISLVLCGITLVLFVFYFFWYGWSIITVIIPIIGILSLSTLVFNHLNLSKISRVWLSLLIPVTTMALSIYSKNLYYDLPEELDYFTFRIVILSCCILPPVFFSLRERSFFFGTSFTILLILMLHDPLHSYFGVPYRQISLKESSYAFTNVVLLLMYVMMTGAIFFMKWMSEVNESKAQVLIGELNETNRKLTEKNKKIERQNEEILDQTDKLNVSRQKLKNAYEIIEEQRNLLFVQNKTLSSELIEKNQELIETNNELIKHNNELRQFSYTVSHNLRGPVASLIGLLKLFQPAGLDPDNSEIFHHIDTSTQRLDNIIKDLSKIIDIRNDIFQIRQQIDLAHEIHEILQVLNREIIINKISITKNLEGARVIYSIRPMVHSILYNLISNSIKYRSTERNAHIEITALEDHHHYVIEVRDNGLGIDLERDKENLFKLYKRFHHHTEGKGLGLYLVKMQAEALGGYISVNSELDKYTSFTVKLKKPQNADRQILFQDDTAEIFFDATLNCIGTFWKEPTYHQYKVVLKKVLDFIKVYNTPNYLADLSAEAGFRAKEKDILFTQIVPEAARNGLKRLAAVHTGEETIHDTSLKENLLTLGVELEYFPNTFQAIAWIEEKNKLRV